MSKLLNTQSILMNSLDKNLWDSYQYFKNSCISGDLNTLHPSKYFTPQILAILFMDIGHSRGSHAPTYYLYTRRFSIQGIAFLQNNLEQFFSLTTTLNHHKVAASKGFSPIINIPEKSAHSFYAIVEPFILPEFKNKLERNIENSRLDFNSNITITQDLKDVLFGTMLGDGYLRTKTKGASWHFELVHAAKQKDLILLKYEALKPFCKHQPWLETRQRSSAPYEYIHLTTRVHPIFKVFGEMFYIWSESTSKYAKKVPSYDILMEYLTPKALAVWFMDDGYLAGSGCSL